jgi:hypothetical protein
VSARSKSTLGQGTAYRDRKPTADLSGAERAELFEDLNYLNLTELHGLCRAYQIPYRIRIELADGGLRTTRDNDRKGVVLARLRRFLDTGERMPSTTLSASVAGSGPPADRPKPTDRIHYSWYQRGNAPVFDVLRTLTGGRFRDGARARTLLMGHWTEGYAPTFAEFADEWLAADQSGESLVSPEYAYLTDLQAGQTGTEWKALRRQRAQRALARLELNPSR